MRSRIRDFLYWPVMIIVISILFFAQPSKLSAQEYDPIPIPQIEFNPRGYVCYKTSEALNIDGRALEKSWLNTKWTEDFIDIAGPSKPTPEFQTRVKMLWDNNYFYVFAEMEEPHLWGTLTERDAVIYHDNDFEVFIDPDGDTHNYYELEVNVLGAVWDLLLTKPYRDNGHAINAFDIQGLKLAVFADGTINDPSDLDTGWSVEIAFPWSVLKQCTNQPTPPEDGNYWRVNFSRVQWKLDKAKDGYQKSINPETGKPYPEDNIVWSPQGLINMHYPEMWGFVHFSSKIAGEGKETFEVPEIEKHRWLLRQVYYWQSKYRSEQGRWSESMEELLIYIRNAAPLSGLVDIETTSRRYEAVIKSQGKTLVLTQDGKIIIRED